MQEIVKLFVIRNIQMWLETAKVIDLSKSHVCIQIVYVLSAIQFPSWSYHEAQGLHQEGVSHSPPLCKACEVQY